MTISPNNTITYSEIIDHITDNIWNKCYNRDQATYNTLPSYVKSGYVQNIRLGSVTPFHMGTYYYGVQVTINSGVIGVGDFNTLKTQLSNYLGSKRILYKDGQEINIGDFIVLFNAVCSFFQTKLVYVIGQPAGVNSNVSYLMYDSSNTTFHDFDILDIYNNNNIQYYCRNIMNILRDGIKLHFIKYNYTCVGGI